MGAWGPGIFDDDTAYDFVGILQDSEDPAQDFKTFFETAIEADYLEYDDAHAVTVSAAYMDMILNHTRYESEDEEGISEFRNTHKNLAVSHLKPLAVKALQKVVSESSELNELWSENEELYPTWKKNIKDLMTRLS